MPVKPEGAKGAKLAGLPCGRPKITTATKEEMDNITTTAFLENNSMTSFADDPMAVFSYALKSKHSKQK
jgi:hypothetical protein